MTPMQRAWMFAAGVALAGAILLTLPSCASFNSEQQARDWADQSHAVGCILGGLC